MADITPPEDREEDRIANLPLAKTAAALSEALKIKEDSPVLLHFDTFKRYMPLFRREMKMSDDTRKRLSNEYLHLIGWGYRPVHIVIEHAGELAVVLKLPRLFLTAKTPSGDQKYDHLSAVNTNAHQMAMRPDIVDKAFFSYVNQFLTAQNNDELIETIMSAKEETDEILIEFAEATTGIKREDLIKSDPAIKPIDKGGNDWSFED